MHSWIRTTAGSVSSCRQQRAPRDLARLRGHGDLVLQLCFTPDGSRLVAGSLDHTLSVWDMATRERAHLLAGHGPRGTRHERVL